jgi:VWFA-related protein
MGSVGAGNPERIGARLGYRGINKNLRLGNSKGKGRRLNATGVWAYLPLLAMCLFAATISHSQSGRPKQPSNPDANVRSRQVEEQQGSPENAQGRRERSDDSADVVRVSSNLVAVPTTVVDNHGVSVANLKLEDFELNIDGQPRPITEIARSNTPVCMAMLFDNSGSLSESREFEKRAAVRFFENVMRPVDQAAIYSVATEVELSQPMTSDVRRLRQIIEGFAKPEGATSLYDAMIEALNYLKPFHGRRVIVIVSDGRDTISRFDFETTMQRLLGEECQIYVVQAGVYGNANVRDLAAERRMEQFASQSGGAAYIPKSVDDLNEAFVQIATDLAQQYVLSYYPAEDKRDGRYHAIVVRVKTQPNARIRSRKGFLVKPHDPV